MQQENLHTLCVVTLCIYIYSASCACSAGIYTIRYINEQTTDNPKGYNGGRIAKKSIKRV